MILIILMIFICLCMNLFVCLFIFFFFFQDGGLIMVVRVVDFLCGESDNGILIRCLDDCKHRVCLIQVIKREGKERKVNRQRQINRQIYRETEKQMHTCTHTQRKRHTRITYRITSTKERIDLSRQPGRTSNQETRSKSRQKKFDT